MRRSSSRLGIILVFSSPLLQLSLLLDKWLQHFGKFPIQFLTECTPRLYQMGKLQVCLHLFLPQLLNTIYRINQSLNVFFEHCHFLFPHGLDDRIADLFRPVCTNIHLT